MSSPDIYRSSALLEPQENNQARNSFPSIPSGMSGLASLAGVQLPSSSGDRGLYAIEVIKSKAFLKHLLSLDSATILPSLMAIDSYNLNTNTTQYDKNIYNKDSNQWVRRVKPNQNKTPSYIEAHEHFLSILELYINNRVLWKLGFIYFFNLIVYTLKK